MTRFAERTTVPADRSRAEIEKLLSRYGATSFAYGWDGGGAQIGCAINGRHVKFVLSMPARATFDQTPTGKFRSEAAGDREHEQAVRQRWRALTLVIKAKLEAVESGITTFDDEFLAHIVLPDGRRVGDHLRPQIALAYEQGTMPPLLPVPE